ncbi:uncharacterized protein CELE_T21E3.2 [Caenorhabditis elegans]|uniref:Uncharacterized protein n=1 Tax=Caenorhabditis elegans TaxID=6239 RepID=O01766_CAEEL|nr:Uncharacterized protein CELE_T21E3.2 [Caenorhabditis elegans]CCD71368.1 Uncharacterized protein CELE_T21E3.2 [Caenorhabditis elegans]|eukprot:NP_491268.2 Uncharacterized protein CELE_T21E3.2 [Caenorhabditis elegans]
MACIFAELILFVVWTVMFISCSKTSQASKVEEKKPKTSSITTKTITSADLADKTDVSKTSTPVSTNYSTVSKTISMQKEVEKNPNSAEDFNVNRKKTSKFQISKESVAVEMKPDFKKNKDVGGKKEKAKSAEKPNKKEITPPQTIKKTSMEKAGKEEDVKCDEEVSRNNMERSDRTLHFSKKMIRGPVKPEEQMEVEPTPLSWKGGP